MLGYSPQRKPNWESASAQWSTRVLYPLFRSQTRGGRIPLLRDTVMLKLLMSLLRDLEQQAEAMVPRSTRRPEPSWS